MIAQPVFFVNSPPTNPVKWLTGDYILDYNDYTLRCSGNFNVTLLNAANVSGSAFNVKNASTGIINVYPLSGQYVDVYASGSITVSSGINLAIQSDGLNYLTL